MQEVSSETLGHMVGECMAMKHARIQCHNAIAKKNVWLWGVKLPGTSLGGGILKPYLVIKKGDMTFVVDVTVTFEHKESLAEAALRNINTYWSLERERERCADPPRWNKLPGKVIPVVVGSRGAFPK